MTDGRIALSLVPSSAIHLPTWEGTAAANRPDPHHDPEPAARGQRQEL